MADRYWVWGTGNWDASTTTHWSSSSGGAGGASVPTSADNVIFDTASSTANAAYTVTITATANCLDFTMDGPDPADGTKVTWAGSSALNIYGSMNLSGGTAGINNTYAGSFTFKSTSTGKTITTNGVTLARNITFDWVGWEWTLQDTLNNWAFQVMVTRGSFVTNNNTLNIGTFSSSNSNTRSITLWSSTINCSELDLQTITWLTFSAGTSSIVLSKTLPSTCNFWALTLYNFSYTRTASSTTSWNIFFYWNCTFNSFTVNWTNAYSRVLVQSGTKGTARTITAATVTVTNADFQDITGAGAGSWDLSAITGNSGDCGGNSGITFTTPVTTDCSAGTTWSTATWSSRVPLPQDTATFSGAGRTITQDMPRIGSVNFTGSSGLTWTTSTACSVFGSINLTDLATLTASTQAYTFAGRGSNTLTSAWKTWSKELAIACFTWTITLWDALTMGASSPLTLSSGTFTTNNNNITTADSINATFNATVNLGSSTVELTSGGSSTWAFSAGTLNAGTSTIKFSGALITNKTFTGGGKTYNNFWNATTGAFAVTIAGSNTFNQFKVNAGRTQQFTAGTTQTIADPVFTGTLGNVITIGSATAASHTLTKSGGGTVTADYCSISRSTATPVSTWYATNSTNGGNNSGWGFVIAPLALSQTLTLADSIKRWFFASLSQTLAIVSSLGSFSIGKVISQTLTLASSLAKSSTRSLSETVTLVSQAIKGTIISFGELITLSHVSEYLKTVFATLSETLTISEAVVKSSARSVSETLSLAETLAKSAIKSFLEQIAVAGSMGSMAITRIFSETVTIVDSIRKGLFEVFDEAITIAGTLSNSAIKDFSEALAIAGAMGNRAITRIFSETVTLVSTARKLLNGLTEGLWTKIAPSTSSGWTKTPKE